MRMSANHIQIHTPEDTLKKVWGYEKFRPMQHRIISSVLEGHDVLAILPTGGGKSLCFQVPALCLEGMCLVITPIIALMRDQVEQLRQLGVKAAAVFSGMSLKEIDITLDNCIYGDIKFLYVSPERLKSELFIERAKKMKIRLLAVDEAHCISQWGYDFRPSYLEISLFKKNYVPESRMIALTATATREVTRDIVDKLALKSDHRIYIQSFARPNLSFIVRKTEDKETKILEALQKIGGSAIVYVRTRKRTKEIADYLIRNKIPSDYYHGGLNFQERNLKQEKWMGNRFRVMIATNAFGMGINKADVRIVIHADLPDNLESYYQEAGRGGRDGKKAFASLFYQEKDLEELTNRIKLATPEPGLIRRVYQALANYYKIAVGSSLFASYDFDIREFSQTYQLDYLSTFHALKKLEDQGFIQLTDSFYHPSKVLIRITHEDLYKFQVANRSLEPFIKLLLRTYGGEMYGNFTTISEKKLAFGLKSSVQEVEKKLSLLDRQDVIIYDKQKDQPQITFTTPRFDASRLPLDIRFLDARRAAELEKATAMIGYATSEDACRSVFIQRYFGETTAIPCGNCDYCLEKARRSEAGMDEPGFFRKILARIREKPSTIEEIIKHFSDHKEDYIIQCIQQLLDSEELYYDEKGLIHGTS
jgi:ATP-dependent DNA helicase RecQ